MKYFIFYVVHLGFSIINTIIFISAGMYYGEVKPSKWAYYIAGITGYLSRILEFPLVQRYGIQIYGDITSWSSRLIFMLNSAIWTTIFFIIVQLIKRIYKPS